MRVASARTHWPLLSASSSGRSQGSINPNCIGWLHGGMDVKAQDCHYLAITGTNLPCCWVTPAQTGWGEKWYNQDGDGRESLQTHCLSSYCIMSCTYVALSQIKKNKKREKRNWEQGYEVKHHRFTHEKTEKESTHRYTYGGMISSHGLVGHGAVAYS